MRRGGGRRSGGSGEGVAGAVARPSDLDVGAATTSGLPVPHSVRPARARDENDMTFASSWGMARSQRFFSAVAGAVTGIAITALPAGSWISREAESNAWH